MSDGEYSMPTRDTLHRLIEELPESELGIAERFLHYLHATAGPVLRTLLDASLDDEHQAVLLRFQHSVQARD